jgi:hypothetical protein
MLFRFTQRSIFCFVIILSLFVCDAFIADKAGAVCVQPPSGMVAWWPGDGNANDIRGGNNGTLQGGATFAVGEVGQAFSLNGSSAYVSVPNSSSLDVGQITADAWVNPVSVTGGAPIVNKRDLGNVGGYTLEFNGGGAINFYVYVSGAWRVATSSGPLPLNTWTHVAGTYDGTTIRVYFNGVEVGNSAFAGVIQPVVGNLEIGRNIPSPWILFAGLIDEVEIFNRSLSQAEIQAIYNAGSDGKCKLAPADATAVPTMNEWGVIIFTVFAGSGSAYYLRRQRRV